MSVKGWVDLKRCKTVGRNIPINRRQVFKVWNAATICARFFPLFFNCDTSDALESSQSARTQFS